MRSLKYWLFPPMSTVAKPVKRPALSFASFTSIGLWAVVVFAFAAACSNDDLPPAAFDNFEDTTVVSALVGTPLQDPSAFSVADRQAIRTDQSSAFDFAYNVDNSGKSVFLPRAVLGLPSSTGADPGFIRTTVAWDDITSAEQNGYTDADTVSIVEGERYYVRSRITCSIGVPLYGKIEILDIDTAARTIQFRHLINSNCGYRNLQPGVPEE